MQQVEAYRPNTRDLVAEWSIRSLLTGETLGTVLGSLQTAIEERERLAEIHFCEDCDRIYDQVEGEYHVTRLLPDWHVGGHNAAFEEALNDPDLRGEIEVWVNG